MTATAKTPRKPQKRPAGVVYPSETRAARATRGRRRFELETLAEVVVVLDALAAGRPTGPALEALGRSLRARAEPLGLSRSSCVTLLALLGAELAADGELVDALDSYLDSPQGDAYGSPAALVRELVRRGLRGP